VLIKAITIQVMVEPKSPFALTLYAAAP